MASLFLLLLLAFSAAVLTGESAEAKPYDGGDVSRQFYDEIAYLLQQHEAQKQLQGRTAPPHSKYVKNWPRKDLHVGQIAGVTVNLLSEPVIFHRGSNVFGQLSFNSTHHYQHINEGPIKIPTILVLNSSDGSVIHEWGKNRFYLPHGINTDKDGNTWITDVALHQVMKFPPGSEEPTLVLGEAFVPGSDVKHFCKPTDVVVASNGDFFVSDGYCNSRIQKYNSVGKILSEWGHSAGRSNFTIPHSLALVEEQDLLCVADRENQRIQCFSAGLNSETPPGKFAFQIPVNHIGRVYGIAYGGNGLLHGVAKGNHAYGFTVDLESGDVTNTWTREHGFHTPHDIGVSLDGSNIYVGEIKPSRLSKFNFH